MTPERWKREREIFDAALDRAGDAEFVGAECGGDEEMYSDVLRMIEEHRRTGFLDGQPDVAEAARSGSPPVFSAGQIVAGRYRIVRYLSRGGMGEVYEAEDLDLPDMKEHVALKTLLPEIASDQSMVARFKQEIALSRKVQHPNVCGAFDLSRHEVDGSNPVLFLTMRFLPGETLSARLQREGRMSLEVALPLLEQMAEALDAAHRAGVIHRDFKPSNVMLVPSAEGTRAVVTDFGLARRLPTGDDTTSTLSINVAGTLDYMAPELLTGSIATIGTDVYALGMVAYKMVTGALPLSRHPVPPPRTKVPDLDQNWDRAILRAVDANPAVRFSRAGHFVQALRGEPVSVTVRLPVVTGRRAVALGLAAVALAGALAGWRWWENERSRPPAEATALYRTGVDDIHAGAYFAATKALGKAVEIAPRFSLAHARLAEAWVGLDTPVEAGKQMQLARRQDNSGLPQIDRLEIDAVDLTITREFPAAVAKYEEMAKLNGAADPGLYVDLGRAYENAGEPDRAMEAYQRAAEGPLHSPAGWLKLAVLHSRAARTAKAAEAFRQAEESYQRTSNLEGLIAVAYERGTAAYLAGQMEESAAYYQKALDTAHLAGNPQQEIRAKLQLSSDAYLEGDADAAERFAREALDSAQANQMETAAIGGLVKLGAVNTQKRNFDGAEKTYREGLTLARRNQSPRLVALSLLSLASLHDQLARSEDAASEAQQALAYYQANRFTDETLKALTIIGRADYRRGRNSAALESFQQLLDLAEKGQNRPQMALGHESMGLVYSGQERYPQALQEYQKNLALSADPLHIGYARLQIGDILWQLGRYDEAMSMFDQAEAGAAKFPQLKISLVRARANMALSQNHYIQASVKARQALTANAGQSPASAVELKAILGQALAGAGNAKEGLRTCEEALAAAGKLGDGAILVNTSLAALMTRLEAGDRAGALALFRQTEPALSGLPESRWRALALVSRADSHYSGPARQALDELVASWGNDAFRAYLARPDVKQLFKAPITGN